jgi:hypothetical protein
MTGVTQLRELYADEARDISEPTDVMADVLARATARPAPIRRRWIAPVAAAAAVVAVTAGVIGLVGTRHHTAAAVHTLPPMPGRPLSFAATVGPLAGYRIANQYVMLDREVTELARTDGRKVYGGEVVSYLPGRYDSSAVLHGRLVAVNGHRGYFADASSNSAQVDHVSAPRTPTLAWEFAPNQWATVQGFGPSPKTAVKTKSAHPSALSDAADDVFAAQLSIARAVDTTVRTPLLLSFRVGYLPAGLLRGGGDSIAPVQGKNWRATVFFVNQRQAAGRDPDPARPAFYLEAVRQDEWKAPESLPRGAARLTVGGHPAVFEPGTRSGNQAVLTVYFGGARVTIAGSFSRTQLVKVAKSITLASNVNDASTWFDATR